MIRCESCSSASRPKVMHPRHTSETIRPVFPKRRYSMNPHFPFFFVQTMVLRLLFASLQMRNAHTLSQCYTYERRNSEAMEAELRTANMNAVPSQCHRTACLLAESA